MAKDAEADLYPWILSGVLITTVAVAAVIASTHTPALRTPKVPAPRAVGVATPAPALPAPALPAPAPIQTPPAVQPAAQEGLPPGSVWECVVNGERTFSDAPCGARSSIRRLSELNIMDSAAIPPASYVAYDSGYTAPGPDQYTPDVVNDSSSNPEVIVINERMRRAHPPRHNNQFHRPRKE